MLQKILALLIPIVTVCFILITAVSIIAYGRGYRFDFTKKSVNSTGLVVVSSEPSGAQIIIDGKVKTATQATLTLPPGTYTISVAKQGFQSWTKTIKVQGEVVNKIDAFLVPANPSLTALSVTGVANPTLSPDGSRLAYAVPVVPATVSASVADNPGIWILDLVDRPLSLNRDARQIVVSAGLDFSKAVLQWSPDGKQLEATLPSGAAYLLDTDKLNVVPQLAPPAKTLQASWQILKDQRDKEQRAALPKLFTDIATSSAKILAFSPDETRILYQATAAATIPPIITPPLIGTNPTEETRMIKPDMLYVYDVKEDRNYQLMEYKVPVAKLGSKVITAPPPLPQWLPNSRNLVYVNHDKVEVRDYDSTNVRTVYAGPFWDSFAVPWASGGKVVILTNLNTASQINNLYLVNLQ